MKVIILICLLAAVLGDDNQSDRKSFNGLDENRDGFIQLPELLSRFDEIDTNNDGNVTLDEGLASKPREMSLKEFLAYFDFYDKQDGAADQMVSKIAVLLSFVTMDANNDGKISFKEYKKSHLQLLSGIKEKIDTSSDTSSEN
ncbi:uncharacterized protein LOC112569347 [Pomacea canaliculata]|uniref:uncharacterized protein LOC112569347 n=1 Tax=Pomacea canaliculata TaxID=400727 RepID=UPI000D728D56|nr:uncharacterized protein LOC112569347 [Pomacea canaliculata]